MQLSELGNSGKGALDNILYKGRVKNVDINILLSQSYIKGTDDLLVVIKRVLWQKHESLNTWENVLTFTVQDT